MRLSLEVAERLNFSLIHAGLASVFRLAEVPAGATARLFVSGFTPERRPLQLPSGMHTQISPELDAQAFAGLSHPVTTSVVLELSSGERQIVNVEALPLCAWDQREEYAIATAAFVLENDPLALLVRRKSGLTHRIDGSVEEQTLDTLFLAQAEALQFCYLHERGLLGKSGEQLVRFPNQMFVDRGGTCIDLTLLTAAVCVSVGLSPVILVLGERTGHYRHAVAGVWRHASNSGRGLVDGDTLLRAVQRKNLIVFDPTVLAGDQPTFENATSGAGIALDSMGILWGIDVCAARRGPYGIHPLPTEATAGTLFDLPDEVIGPLSQTRSMAATEALKSLRVEVISNGHDADAVAVHGRHVRNLRVGRDPRNHVVFAHSSVSRQHAVIYVRGDDLYVIDTGSLRGTKVNGQVLQPLTPVRLSQDQRVTFGDVQVRILRGSGEDHPG